MWSRVGKVVLCCLGLWIMAMVLQVVAIMLNIRSGTKIQESLLTTLRERYPDQSFVKRGVGKGGAFEEGPSVSFHISSRPDPQARKEMLDFIVTETESKKYRATIYLVFEAENKEFTLYRSRKLGLNWEERPYDESPWAPKLSQNENNGKN